MRQHPRVQVSDSALEGERIANVLSFFFFMLCQTALDSAPPRSLPFSKGEFRRNVNIGPFGMLCIPEFESRIFSFFPILHYFIANFRTIIYICKMIYQTNIYIKL